MRITRIGALLVCLLISAITTVAQKSTTSEPLQRDPQAVALLAQSLVAAGGAQALAAVQDFTASGTITYSWASEDVKGSVTLRERGIGQFRLDANLPDGIHSWLVSQSEGSLKDASGTITSMPYQNARNLGFLSFPYLKILSALNDPSVAITLADTSSFNGQAAIGIQIQQGSAANADPGGSVARLSQIEFVLDPSSKLVLAQRDTILPTFNPTNGISHEIEFADYQSLSGVLVPYSVSETVNGQQTWKLQIGSIKFNSGLSDSDFQF